MRAKPMKRPRAVLLLWCAGLCLLAAVLALLNFVMLRYAESERERDHKTWIARANTALLAGDYESARADIVMARHLAPGHPEPLISEGHLHYRLKKWNMAVEAYQLAIRYGSDDAGIRQNIVWACVELGLHKKAAQLGRQYMEEQPIGEQLPRYLAEAHYRMGAYKSAIPYLRKALELEPGDLYLYDKLERCYRQSGQAAEADALRNHIGELQSELSNTSEIPE